MMDRKVNVLKKGEAVKMIGETIVLLNRVLHQHSTGCIYKALACFSFIHH